MKEIPLQFGEGRRLFGILTTADENPPKNARSKVFVFLNSGLLHRVGPHRLHVRLARELAQVGINSLRVDLAGVGDSPVRAGLSVPESVALDFKDILSVLQANLGTVSIVLVGLCSGADNALANASSDSRVVGLVLMDPVCDPDAGFIFRDLAFRARKFVKKCSRPARYINWAKRRLHLITTQDTDFSEQMDVLDLRNIPPVGQVEEAFLAIRERGGRVLSIFTGYAMRYYNKKGQMGKVINIDRYEDFCEEVFWPDADHTYPLKIHQDRLVQKITEWAVES